MDGDTLPKFSIAQVVRCWPHVLTRACPSARRRGLHHTRTTLVTVVFCCDAQLLGLTVEQRKT